VFPAKVPPVSWGRGDRYFPGPAPPTAPPLGVPFMPLSGNLGLCPAHPWGRVRGPRPRDRQFFGISDPGKTRNQSRPKTRLIKPRNPKGSRAVWPTGFGAGNGRFYEGPSWTGPSRFSFRGSEPNPQLATVFGQAFGQAARARPFTQKFRARFPSWDRPLGPPNLPSTAVGGGPRSLPRPSLQPGPTPDRIRCHEPAILIQHRPGWWTRLGRFPPGRGGLPVKGTLRRMPGGKGGERPSVRWRRGGPPLSMPEARAPSRFLSAPTGGRNPRPEKAKFGVFSPGP